MKIRKIVSVLVATAVIGSTSISSLAAQTNRHVPTKVNFYKNQSCSIDNFSKKEKVVLDATNTVFTVIDVQKFFIPGHPESFSPEIPGQNTLNKIENVKKLLGLADKTKAKTLITFEMTNEGTYDMPEDVKATVPKENTQVFFKTYFDITKKAEVDAYLKSGNQKNIIVCGAETDVCILQSVQGLISKGYNVFLVTDATYTSTTLDAPAVNRMKLSGATMITTQQLLSVFGKNKKIQLNPMKYKIADLKAEKEAFVMVNYDDESLAAVEDPKEDAKNIRFDQMNHFAEVYGRPIYYIYDGSVDQVKQSIYTENVKFIKADRSIDEAVVQLALKLKKEGVSQIVLGGIDEKSDVSKAAIINKLFGMETHLMEDAFIKDGGSNQKLFDALYLGGIVPASLKIVGYDNTESADMGQIPEDWIERWLPKLQSGEIKYVEDLPFVKDSQ